MKRSRAEPNPPSKFPSLSPKTQKKSNPNPKPARARRADNASGGLPAAAAVAEKEAEEVEECICPTADGYPSESKEAGEERLGLDLGFGDGDGDGEGFGIWCGSVEEEVLLGWFPWTAGPVHGEEEEEEEGDFDIWQLQQIHEIPGTAKRGA